jgi:predicted dehydrogenase
MSGDVAVVRAVGRVSKTLRDLGEDDIFDELRVIIEAQDGATAYFTFSSQMQPSLNQFRVFGKRNGIMMDEDNQTVVTLRGSRYKSYAEKFIPPLIMAREYKRCFWRNLGCFLGRDFHMKAGMKCLIEGFYRSIAMGGTPPISNREILLVSRIMEDIFRQTEQARTGRVSL